MPIATLSFGGHDVSRETLMSEIEREPAGATTLFGDRIELARGFAAGLTAQGEKRGLIGPQELPRLWSRHLLNCAAAAPAFAGTVGDIGSGAGFPGLVLAIARPDVNWVLIEPMERRATWLREQVGELGLENVEVVRSRAQEWQRGPTLDAVTARAVSALRTLVPISVPLVRTGGEIVFLKGASVDSEITSAAASLRKAGIRDIRVQRFGEGVLDEPTRVVRGTVRAR